jgi:hypothetical protein
MDPRLTIAAKSRSSEAGTQALAVNEQGLPYAG